MNNVPKNEKAGESIDKPNTSCPHCNSVGSSPDTATKDTIKPDISRSKIKATESKHDNSPKEESAEKLFSHKVKEATDGFNEFASKYIKDPKEHTKSETDAISDHHCVNSCHSCGGHCHNEVGNLTQNKINNELTFAYNHGTYVGALKVLVTVILHCAKNNMSVNRMGEIISHALSDYHIYIIIRL